MKASSDLRTIVLESEVVSVQQRVSKASRLSAKSSFANRGPSSGATLRRPSFGEATYRGHNGEQETGSETGPKTASLLFEMGVVPAKVGGGLKICLRKECFRRSRPPH